MRKEQRGRHEARKARSHRSGTLGRGGRVALSVLACALAISGAGAIGYSMLTHRTTVSGGTQYADVFKKGQAYDSVDAQQFIANPTVTDEDREVIASLSGLMQQIYARETGDATAAKAWAEQTLPQLASWNDLQLPWSNSDVDPKTYVRLAELSRMELKSKAQSLGLESDLQWQVIDFAYPAYEGDTGAVLGNAGQAQTTTRAAAILGNTGEPTVLEVITACDQKIRKDGVLHDGDEVNFRMDTYCIDISDENPTQEVHNIWELKSFGFELVSGPTFDAKEAQGSQISGAVGNSSGSSSGNSFHEVPDGTQRINQGSNQQTNQNGQGQGSSDITGNQSQQPASNVMENPTQSGNNVNGTNEMAIPVADIDITDEDAQALAGVTVTIGGKKVDNFNPRKINAVADVTDLPELVTALNKNMVIPQEYVPVFHNLPDGWEVSLQEYHRASSQSVNLSGEIVTTISCQVVLSNHYNNKSYQYVIDYRYVEKSNTSSSNGQNGASVSTSSNMASSYVTTRLMANTNLGVIVRDVRYYRWAQNANYEVNEVNSHSKFYESLWPIIRASYVENTREPVELPFYLGYYSTPDANSSVPFNTIVIDSVEYDGIMTLDNTVLLNFANQIAALPDEEASWITHLMVQPAAPPSERQVMLHSVPLNSSLPNISLNAQNSQVINVPASMASKMSFIDGFQYAGNLGMNGTYADDVLLVVAKNENGFQIVFDRDADAKKKAEEEAAAKKKAEEEAAAKKKAEEEAAAKKKAEEEAAARLAALKSALRKGPVTVVSSVIVTTDALIDTPGYDPTKDGVPTSGITYQCSLDGAGNPTGCSIVQNRGRAGGPSSDALTVDGDGFFTQVSSAASGSASWKLEKDDAGRLTKMSGTIGGVAVSYTYEYDGAGTRLVKMTHASGSDKDVTVFNADGSRATVTRHVGQKDEFVEKYTHIKNSQNQITQTNIQTSKGVDTWEYWYNTDGTVRMIIAAENQFSPRGYMYSYKSISSPSVAAGLASRVMVTPDATIPYGSPFLKLN